MLSFFKTLKNQCPKCGYAGIMRRFIAAKKEHIQEEYLSCKCSGCDYKWKEDCLDKR